MYIFMYVFIKSVAFDKYLKKYFIFIFIFIIIFNFFNSAL